MSLLNTQRIILSKNVYKAQNNQGQYLIKKDSKVINIVYTKKKAQHAIEDLVEGIIANFIVDKGYSK